MLSRPAVLVLTLVERSGITCLSRSFVPEAVVCRSRLCRRYQDKSSVSFKAGFTSGYVLLSVLPASLALVVRMLKAVNGTARSTKGLAECFEVVHANEKLSTKATRDNTIETRIGVKQARGIIGHTCFQLSLPSTRRMVIGWTPYCLATSLIVTRFRCCSSRFFCRANRRLMSLTSCSVSAELPI